MKDNTSSLEIWISASVSGDEGGYGAVVRLDDDCYTTSGKVNEVTTNEIRFIGLSRVITNVDKPCNITVYTKCDWAAHVINGDYKLKAEHLIKVFNTLSDTLSGHFRAEYVSPNNDVIEQAHELARKARKRSRTTSSKDKEELPQVHLWTDGSSRGQHGPGGWAAILRYKGHEKVLTGNDGNTTSNEMEFKAIVEGIAALKEACNVLIHTDSQLAAGAFSGSYNMKAEHLVEILDEFNDLVEREGHWVQLMKVPAHSGIHDNERADKLAKEARDEAPWS